MVSYNKESPETIQAMFGSIAKDYDRTNALLSFQLHRYWNRQLINATALHFKHPHINFADLCCGTGDIACNWLKRSPAPQKGYLIDFCEEMLGCARAKISNLNLKLPHEIHFLNADVQKLPLPSLSIDFMTIAYGIRNVKNPAECFSEVFRALKPCGRFGILELTEPNNWLLNKMHGLYLQKILPVIGKKLTSNQQAYEYLSRSIGAFTKPKDLASQLKASGFSNVEIKPLTGGIVTLIVATKELDNGHGRIGLTGRTDKMNN